MVLFFFLLFFRMRDYVFNEWKRVVHQQKESVRMARVIRLRECQKCVTCWRNYAHVVGEQRRLQAKVYAAQEQKVNQVLIKILRRFETKIFNQWLYYTKNSIHIKGMMRRNLLEKKKWVKDRWYINCRDAIEERRMMIEPTVFIREDDLTRRLHHAAQLSEQRTRRSTSGGPPEDPASEGDDNELELKKKKKIKKNIKKYLQPYIIGPGESWKRKSIRMTTIRSCLYRARKIGDTIQIPGHTPMTEQELHECMKFKSFVSTTAPLSASDGRTIAEFLIGNQQMRSLLLYNGQLEDKGTMAIAATLALDPTPEVPSVVLQTLGIGNQHVGPRGAAAIGKLLKIKHCTLTCLYLENNPLIGDLGMKAFAESFINNIRLEKLVLSSNNISDIGCEALAESLQTNRSLRTLVLNHNNIGCRGFLSLMNVMSSGRNKMLSNLSIHHNIRISDDGAAVLGTRLGSGHMIHVQEIDLSGCGINDHGAVSLEKSFLKLGGNGGGDIKSTLLNGNSEENGGNSEENDEENEWNDEKNGERNEKIQMMALSRLNLCDNFIHGTVAQRLSVALTKVTTSCALDLEGNPIDSETKGKLIFNNFNKRLGSPRKKSPRKGEMISAATAMSVLKQPPDAPTLRLNQKFLPSRAAMESLGQVGLDKIKNEEGLPVRSPPRGGGRREEDEEVEEDDNLSFNIPSFSPAGFTLKVLPPVKPGLLSRGKKYKY